ISLSSWLRDYLYIPLGGSRGTRLFTYRNIMITMVLGGLWHGGAWTFVIWGTLHGIALVVHREWQRRAAKFGWLQRLVAGLALPVTFWWVCIAWILFRATDLHVAGATLRSFVTFVSDGAERLG